MVVPVYGSMTSQAQRRIFTPAPEGIRKVVVATEIASTSLTVEGVVYVVDAGFVKQSIYNPKTGLDSLKIVPISRAEAKQRAGRAGRTRPGECYRIYECVQLWLCCCAVVWCVCGCGGVCVWMCV